MPLPHQRIGRYSNTCLLPNDRCRILCVLEKRTQGAGPKIVLTSKSWAALAGGVDGGVGDEVYGAAVPTGVVWDAHGRWRCGDV